MIDLKKHVEKAIEYIDIFNKYELLIGDFTDLCAKTGLTFEKIPFYDDYESEFDDFECKFKGFSFEKCFGSIKNYSKEDLVLFKETIETIVSFNYDSLITLRVKFPNGKYREFDVYKHILFDIKSELLKRLASESGLSIADLKSEIKSLE